MKDRRRFVSHEHVLRWSRRFVCYQVGGGAHRRLDGMCGAAQTFVRQSEINRFVTATDGGSGRDTMGAVNIRDVPA